MGWRTYGLRTKTRTKRPQAQLDMMYWKKLLESMCLRLHPPMIFEVDNRGAVDFVNSFSVGGRTRHIETRQYYFRELNENDMLIVRWKKVT
jgi:hypothetical protein